MVAKKRIKISKAVIRDELVVGITAEMKDALEVVCACQGIKPSQFGRLCIIEKLTAMQMMESPGQVIAQRVLRARAAANAELASAD